MVYMVRKVRMMSEYEALETWLKRRMTELHLRTADLSAMTGLHYDTIKRYRGGTQVPQWDNLKKLEKALGRWDGNVMATRHEKREKKKAGEAKPVKRETVERDPIIAEVFAGGPIKLNLQEKGRMGCMMDCRTCGLKCKGKYKRPLTYGKVVI